MTRNELLKGLTEEQIAKAKACKSEDELIELARRKKPAHSAVAQISKENSLAQDRSKITVYNITAITVAKTGIDKSKTVTHLWHIV